MTIHPHLLLAAAVCSFLMLVGCDSSQDAQSQLSDAASLPPSVQQSPFVLDTSIQDIMVSVVNPAADAISQSVSTIVTAESVEQVQPQTDEEWQTLRNQTVILMEAGNLLAMTSRPVVDAGKQLENEGVYGNLTSAEMRTLIDKTSDQYIAFSQSLYRTTAKVLQAVDNRDADAVFELSNSIYGVCEGCHSVYWYPNQ